MKVKVGAQRDAGLDLLTGPAPQAPPAPPAPKTAAPPVTADELNRILRAGRKRALELEPQLIALLIPIIEAAGREAARKFRDRATEIEPTSLTAATGPPRFHPPGGDEIVNVDALVASLRGKTDPVRQAVVQTMMEPALNSVGLSFDVTNPLTAKVLQQSGSQIVGIADTTQLNVMRIVRRSYEEGLSIPSTAEAITQGMSGTSEARATLIARTELAGAVQGGSLASVQIVDDASGGEGGGYRKTWLTASGAKYPRHETYDDLDGQTVALDELFQVGSDQLQFPGDPDGSPEEICNCRCTLVYEDASGGTVDAEVEGEG